ncbi:hypothetical protein GIY23_21390 [Allosaccharopolyspora coralli]|uniref:Uncharacterized protein n=1 Tax=Allosaccharopolyspora coralli TaxID=2665642 RepID=A0A5Q3QAY9_9PSEU|nr:hypothetical protein [Allosaccharopolyspora coralli]QGK71728.1 hypothetical protein GIY23_21390 [Allosaccharopolyspora coralli]
MIRIGLGIMALAVVVYVIGAHMTTPPPDAVGANIGAGLVSLLVMALMLLGVLVALSGIVRHLVVRKRRRQSPSLG